MDGLRFVIGCFFSLVVFVVSGTALCGWRAHHGTAVAFPLVDLVLLALFALMVGLLGAFAFLRDQSALGPQPTPWPIQQQVSSPRRVMTFHTATTQQSFAHRAPVSPPPPVEDEITKLARNVEKINREMYYGTLPPLTFAWRLYPNPESVSPRGVTAFTDGTGIYLDPKGYQPWRAWETALHEVAHVAVGCEHWHDATFEREFARLRAWRVPMTVQQVRWQRAA